jgi:hypothetical protein
MPKKKGMNRTAGTARRKMSASERVSYGLKTGAPLTGSASGVKSISLREAGEALTQGIVTSRGGKLKFAPEGLAMALPLGKVAKAAQALRLIGKSGPVQPLMQAAALEARLAAKVAGKTFGGTGKKSQGLGKPMDRAVDVGGRARAASESVFPRAPKKSPTGKPDLGDLAAKETPFMTPQMYRRYVKKAQKAAEGTRVTQLENRLKLPKGRGK